LLKESLYWEEKLSNKNFAIISPESFRKKHGKFKDIKLIEKEFDREFTKQLSIDAPVAYNLNIQDILIVALGYTLYNLSGNPNIAVEMERHGREEFEHSNNISGVIGWFTSIFPFYSKIDENKNLGHNIKNIKEALRNIPLNGIGFGILKYLAKKDYNVEYEVGFNFLGEFDSSTSVELFEIDFENVGNEIDENANVLHGIDISGLIQNEILKMKFSFDSTRYNYETIKKLSDEYESQLRLIVQHCLSIETPEFTPSDFDAKALDMEDLDSIMENLE